MIKLGFHTLGSNVRIVSVTEFFVKWSWRLSLVSIQSSLTQGSSLLQNVLSGDRDDHMEIRDCFKRFLRQKRIDRPDRTVFYPCVPPDCVIKNSVTETILTWIETVQTTMTSIICKPGLKDPRLLHRMLRLEHSPIKNCIEKRKKEALPTNNIFA